jgi:hypothetical protein
VPGRGTSATRLITERGSATPIAGGRSSLSRDCPTRLLRVGADDDRVVYAAVIGNGPSFAVGRGRLRECDRKRSKGYLQWGFAIAAAAGVVGTASLSLVHRGVLLAAAAIMASV